MRRQKLLLWVLRLCLSGMLALILHEFLADGAGLGVRPKLLSFLPLMISYIIGGFFPGKRRGWLLLLPACAGSMYLQTRLTGTPLSLSAETGLYAIDAILLFVLGWSRTEAWPAALGLPAVGFSLLTCAILSWRGQSAAFPGLCAVQETVICLLDMHREGMEAGLHNAPGEVPMPYPKGLRGKNWLLLVLFLGVSLGLAALPFLQNGADWLWGNAVSGTKELTSGIAASLRERADQPPAETPAPTPSPSPTPSPEPGPGEDAPGESIPPVLRYGWIFAAVLLIATLLYLWHRGGKTGLSLRKLWDSLKRLLRENEQDVPYVDEVEKTRPWRSLTEPAKERVIKRVRKAGRKRIKLSDLPDDRMRIRYVYRELIRSPAGAALSPALTPSEVGDAVDSAPIRSLTEEYNLVRYAPGAEISDDAGSIAASALQEVRSAAGKQAAARRAARTRHKPDTARRAASLPAQGSGEDRSGHACVYRDTENTAILPAVPVWLPFANVWENIRCAAQDKATALRAAEVVGLPDELLHKSPNTLTEEQRWLAVMARSLAAGAGRWEADVSALEPDAAEVIKELLHRLSEQEGIEVAPAEYLREKTKTCMLFPTNLRRDSNGDTREKCRDPAGGRVHHRQL